MASSDSALDLQDSTRGTHSGGGTSSETVSEAKRKSTPLVLSDLSSSYLSSQGLLRKTQQRFAFHRVLADAERYLQHLGSSTSSRILPQNITSHKRMKRRHQLLSPDGPISVPSVIQPGEFTAIVSLPSAIPPTDSSGSSNTIPSLSISLSITSDPATTSASISGTSYQSSTVSASPTVSTSSTISSLSSSATVSLTFSSSSFSLSPSSSDSSSSLFSLPSSSSSSSSSSLSSSTSFTSLSSTSFSSTLFSLTSSSSTSTKLSSIGSSSLSTSIDLPSSSFSSLTPLPLCLLHTTYSGSHVSQLSSSCQSVPTSVLSLSSTLSPTTSPSGSSQSLVPYTSGTTTEIFTTTDVNGHTKTVTSVVSSGVLSTNTSNDGLTGFARNKGAIIGVALGGTTAVIFAVIIIFFACGRYRARTRANNQMLNFAPRVWRPPLDGDNDEDYHSGMAERYEGLIAALGHELGGTSHGHSENIGSDSGEDIRSAEAPSISAENIANLPRVPSQQQQSYMPGFGQAAETLATADTGNISPTLPRLSSSGNGGMTMSTSRRMSTTLGPDPGLWFGGRDIGLPLPSSHGHSSGQDHGIDGSESVGHANSSGGHPGTSSGGHGYSSGSSQAPLINSSPADTGRPSSRMSQTPPTSFGFMDKGNERERDNSDSMSLKGFLGRLRGGRGSSSNVAQGFSSDVDQDIGHAPRLGFRDIVIHQSHSSPQIRVRPPSSLLHPPGSSPATLSSSLTTRRPTLDVIQHPPWPPASLPPSPAVTVESLTLDGLLHPRLLGMGSDAQESVASFRDHVDYSRPIGGIINNYTHSSTTFDTQDIIDIVASDEVNSS